jgi:hypothetical protein
MILPLKTGKKSESAGSMGNLPAPSCGMDGEI